MSPKNKGKFGKGKSPVELDDEFVTGVTSVADKIKPHLKVIIGVTVALTALIIAYQTYLYLGERTAAKATELYREALAAAQLPVIPTVEETPDDTSAEAADATDAADELPETFPTRDAQLAAILAPLEQLSTEYGSSEAGRTARLFHAATLYDAVRYDEASALYQQITADSDDPEIVAIAREGLGYTQEAMALANDDQGARKSGLEQALATFQALEPADDGPRREQALYHEGRILAALGRRDEAVATFQKAAAIDAASPLRYEIRQRLALLGAAAE